MSLTDGTTMTMPVAPTGMGGNGWGGFGGRWRMVVYHPVPRDLLRLGRQWLGQQQWRRCDGWIHPCIRFRQH